MFLQRGTKVCWVCESVWCVVWCMCTCVRMIMWVFGVLHGILPSTTGVSAKDLRWNLCEINVKDMGTQTRCVRVGRHACVCAGVCVCSLSVYIIWLASHTHHTSLCRFLIIYILWNMPSLGPLSLAPPSPCVCRCLFPCSPWLSVGVFTVLKVAQQQIEPILFCWIHFLCQICMYYYICVFL